jgi:hypothetical protein
MYITRLPSNEIFSPSYKIHREVGRAKDLSAPLYYSASCSVAKPVGSDTYCQNPLVFLEVSVPTLIDVTHKE